MDRVSGYRNDLLQDGNGGSRPNGFWGRGLEFGGRIQLQVRRDPGGLNGRDVRRNDLAAGELIRKIAEGRR
jgi:hypothetical protein